MVRSYFRCFDWITLMQRSGALLHDIQRQNTIKSATMKTSIMRITEKPYEETYVFSFQ